MNRRTLLTAVIGCGVGTVAGCTSVGGKTPLAHEEQSDEAGALLRFSENDDDVMTLQLQEQYLDEREREYYPFRISTWQPDGVRLSSLRLEFRSPPRSSGFSPAGIHLREEDHAGYVELHRDSDDPSTTVLEMPDVADIGHGSVSVHILLSGDDARDQQELWMGVEAGLSSEGLVGTEYSANGETTLEVP